MNGLNDAVMEAGAIEPRYRELSDLKTSIIDRV